MIIDLLKKNYTQKPSDSKKKSIPKYIEILEELNRYSDKINQILENFAEYEIIAHNDFNFTNILRFDVNRYPEYADQEGSEGLMLIDYEYTGKSYLFYEIANMYHSLNCRMVGNPSIFTLVGRPQNKNIDDLKRVEAVEREFTRKVKNEYPACSKMAKMEDSEFENIVEGFKALPYFYWTALAISTSIFDELDFDYVRYSELKLESFLYYYEKFKVLI